ncbi:polysaccharide biosynthesis protein [Halieaceae bacterium IMCC14734]|uniref:Polysaccharide biosynthesis protein n=2 Tax=Candidatus Litorirhabdus singularis TaxID=2518993 RepID=A0ABT3TFU4_9GAMM|nr:polysaccharide biosynthesis protein [Candidatus Litorirhabdus singularis]
MRSMSSSLVLAFEKMLELPRNIKQILLLLLDMFFVCAAMWAAIAMRLGTVDFNIGVIEIVCAAATVVISAIIFLRLGLYRAVIRFMGQQAAWAIVRGVSYSTMVLGACIFFSQAHVPRSLPFVYWALALLFIGGGRMVVRAYYQDKVLFATDKVIIYGAGESGRQLLTALSHGDQFRPVFFVDDNAKLQHSVINGVQVVKPQDVEKLIAEHDISQVLLAMPSVSGERRREIINSLVGLPVYVRTVPKFSDLLLGKANVTQIQDIELEDLLGRDPVPPHPELIDRCITGKVVMVTGAGGSIGSELCRQILLSKPRELLLLDISEYALYKIERELRDLLRSSGLEIELIPLLGSVQDKRRIERLFTTFEVQTVYHAAAYKHVPLVEYNIAEGVANNVFGTVYAAEAAIDAGVETFVLVSTDKAVRPTNIMGASKRLAEMVCQGLTGTENNTRFCMVRFGNVLGSSGSVVPLFREQIRAHGPLTVTHSEVTRYFMTIPEAAQLVLQASALGIGGDVFVLDMGDPVRILDLAKRMIHLSGYSVRDEDNPQGDISIQFTGLRPGEKLFEELLLGTNVTGTGHPMIMRAVEEYPPMEEIRGWLDNLKSNCDEMDCESIKAILLKAVSGFEGHQGMHDHVWKKQMMGSQSESSNVQMLFPMRSADN